MNSMNYGEIFCILQFQEEKWHMAFSFSYIKQTLFLHIGNDGEHLKYALYGCRAGKLRHFGIHARPVLLFAGIGTCTNTLRRSLQTT